MMNQCTESHPVSPARGEVCHLYPRIVLSHLLAPLQQILSGRCQLLLSRLARFQVERLKSLWLRRNRSGRSSCSHLIRLQLLLKADQAVQLLGTQFRVGVDFVSGEVTLLWGGDVGQDLWSVGEGGGGFGNWGFGVEREGLYTRHCKANKHETHIIGKV